MGMFSLVVLDFDGTLADTQPLIVSSLQRTICELHLPSRTYAECCTVIGLPLKECFSELLSVDETMADQCAEVYRRIFAEDNHTGTVTLFPRVLETIQTLHERDVILAICSSRARPTLDAFIQDFHLNEYVSMVVSANDVQHAKPHPEPVQQILQRLQIAAENTLVVGDANYDILMGRAAGCHTCGVTYGNQSVAVLRQAGADFLINDFGELLRIVN